MRRAFWRMAIAAALYVASVAMLAEVWHLAAQPVRLSPGGPPAAPAPAPVHSEAAPVAPSEPGASEKWPVGGSELAPEGGSESDTGLLPRLSRLVAALTGGVRRDAALLPDVRAGSQEASAGSASAGSPARSAPSASSSEPGAPSGSASSESAASSGSASSGSASSESDRPSGGAPTGGSADALPAAAPPQAADDPSAGTSEAPILPAILPAEEHGVFLPDDAQIARQLADLGIPYLMGSYSTNFNHATPSQADNIALAAKKLNGQIVQPGEVFSYNAVVGPYTQAGGYGWGRMFVGTRIVPSIGGGVCQGASTLYNAVILANLEVVERHQHGLTVPYLPPGQDATVTDTGGLDFRFRNTTDRPILIRASSQNRWMTISIYGGVKPPKVTWKHVVLGTTKKGVVFTRDASLPPGIRKTVAPGQDGVVVHTWITIHYPDGAVTKDLGIDRYKASPQVVAVGPSR